MEKLYLNKTEMVAGVIMWRCRHCRNENHKSLLGLKCAHCKRDAPDEAHEPQW